MRIALLLLSGLVLAQHVHAQALELTVIDVGQGDSILIAFPLGSTGNRKHMLIDGGNSAAANNAVMQVLNDKSITTIDVMVLTHPHSDHYKGLKAVLESDDITVKEFWWTGEERGPPRDATTPTTWEAFETAMDQADEIVLVTPGTKRTFQKAKVEVLMAGGNHPETNKGRDINNDSLMLMLSFKSVKVLLPGDIQAAGGMDLVNTYCSRSVFRCRKLDSDIIKIPHHGSAHLAPKFVMFADAEKILISAGDANRQFHHPRETAIQAYRDTGADEVFSTSLEGVHNITVTIGPGKDEFSIDGPSSGYTSWREMDEAAEDDDATCDTEEHQGFCLELAP